MQALIDGVLCLRTIQTQTRDAVAFFDFDTAMMGFRRGWSPMVAMASGASYPK